MTGAGADIFPFQLQGADWWIMNVDGSGKRRLTFMNAARPRAVGEPLSPRRLALVRQRHGVLRRRHDAVARPRRQDRARRLRLSRGSHRTLPRAACACDSAMMRLSSPPSAGLRRKVRLLEFSTDKKTGVRRGLSHRDHRRCADRRCGRRLLRRAGRGPARLACWSTRWRQRGELAALARAPRRLAGRAPPPRSTDSSGRPAVPCGAEPGGRRRLIEPPPAPASEIASVVAKAAVTDPVLAPAPSWAAPSWRQAAPTPCRCEPTRLLPAAAGGRHRPSAWEPSPPVARRRQHDRQGGHRDPLHRPCLPRSLRGRAHAPATRSAPGIDRRRRHRACSRSAGGCAWSRPAYAQVLQGGAIAVLYLTLFAAFRYYGVLAALPAFALMVAVAGLAAALAVLQDAPAARRRRRARRLRHAAHRLDRLRQRRRALRLLLRARCRHRRGRLVPDLAGAQPGRLRRHLRHRDGLGRAALSARFVRDERSVSRRLLPALRPHHAAAGPARRAGRQRRRAATRGSTAACCSACRRSSSPSSTAWCGTRRSAPRSPRSRSPRSTSRSPRGCAGRPALGITFDASLAIATIFLTLVIPFALDARSTAGAWTLEAAGLVWVGFRQGRGLPRAFGYLLHSHRGPVDVVRARSLRRSRRASSTPISSTA